MMKTLGMAMIVVVMFLAVSVCGSRESMAQAQQAGTGGAAEGKLILDSLHLGDKVELNLVLIPAGKFLMGSPETEEGRVNDEVQHEVTISKPFYMGATHVTVDQFAAFVKDSGYKTDAEKAGWSTGIEIKDGKLDLKKVNGCSWRKASFGQKGDHPVVQVSWNDATAFCGWLSKKSRLTVVLPTEAQWEYACRAGTKTAYPWGTNPDDGKGWANCADQSFKKKFTNASAELFTWDDGFVFTSPVGSFRPNAFGLYDMIGNAWQWCQDDKAAGTDPEGAATGGLLRGGAWSAIPEFCRSASHIRYNPDNRHDFGGFRVVVVAASAD